MSLRERTIDRAITASGPRNDVESLRSAYLDLLKLAVCDLVHLPTTSLGRLEDDSILTREIDGEQLRLRTNGMDWPKNGLAMSGLVRLDDAQRCVEQILADDVPGELIEAGAWRGGTAILMRATLDAHGSMRKLLVADSFAGFPNPDPARYPADAGTDLEAVDFLTAPLEDVKASFSRLGCAGNVEFVKGFFADTMPTLTNRRWSLIRADGDTYEATSLTLRALYPGLSVGGYMIIDDYGALDECRAAVDDFRRENAITEPLENVDWTCVRWRRESDAPLSTPPLREPLRSRARRRLSAMRGRNR